MNRRNTKQRKIVLDVVRSRCDHPSVDQIYDDVHSKDESISLGTVYRNLDILTKEHKIADVRVPGATRYDLRTDRHDHFVCEDCGKVFDIEVESMNVEKNVIDGFSISSVSTIYKGLCPKCLKKKK